MSDLRLELTLANAAATEALGTALAGAFLELGSASGVVYWRGDLGAGKTTCIRSLLRRLGVVGGIRSPTYTLLETYPLPSLTCIHVDLYRLAASSEVDELGLRDGWDGPSLLLVEWPEKGGGALPRADLVVQILYQDDARRGVIETLSEMGRQWLQPIHDGSFTSYVSNLT